MWIHRFVGLSILLMTLYQGLLKLSKYGYRPPAGKPHHIFGTVLVLIVIFPVLGGVLARSRLRRQKWNTKNTLRLKNVHRAAGWALIVAA